MTEPVHIPTEAELQARIAELQEELKMLKSILRIVRKQPDDAST